MRLPPSKENKWPFLHSEGYDAVSPQTWDYNCIAFAADIDTKWWWPDADGDAEWPIKRREVTLDCFIEAYETLGYRKCRSPRQRRGFEKIAIYSRHGEPTHAAKQLPDGRWKSKLGDWEDIEHNTLKAVEEYVYGKAVVFLERRQTSCQRTNPLARFGSFLSRLFGRQQSMFSLIQSGNLTSS
jgi:hypothetical protein